MPQLLPLRRSKWLLRPSHLARGFPGWWTLFVQFVLVGAAALLYFGVRGLTQSGYEIALDNALDLVRFERAIGLDWEAWVQGLVIDHDALVTLANWLYIYGHWPVIGVTLGVLFMRFPDRFYLLRNALFVSGAIGLVFFVTFPVAPPRLGGLDLVDTVTQRSNSYRTLQPPGLINRYAALPSLHFGWNLLVGVILWGTTRHVIVRTFALVLPPLMAFAVVATANHYVIDVVVGGVVAVAGLLVARQIPRVRETPRWARSPGDA